MKEALEELTEHVKSYLEIGVFLWEVLKRKYGQDVEDRIIHDKVIALWSLVHGLSTAVTIKGVVDTDHLEDEIERILLSINV